MLRAYRKATFGDGALGCRSLCRVASVGLWLLTLMVGMHGGASAGGTDPFAAQGLVRFEQQPMAPDFTLPDQDGTLRSLREFRGNVVVLIFWTTW